MENLQKIITYLSGHSHFILHSKRIQEYIAVTLGCCHIVLLALFLYCNISTMVLINILSILTYIVAIYIAKHRYSLVFYKLIYWEILIHLFVASINVGYGCGFELYCMAIIPYSYYCQYSLTQYEDNSSGCEFNPFIHSLISLFFYIFLQIYSRSFKSLYIMGSENIRHIIYSINFLIVMAALIIFMSTFITQAFILENRLKAQNNNLEKLSFTDSLTGLYNRRSLHDFINQCKSSNTEFTIIMSDIDDFKYINDQHGHESGDAVLKKTAKIFTESTCADDIVCRWGGEEILVLLPKCSLKNGKHIAEIIRSKINNTSITNRDEIINFTMTFGIAHSSQKDNIEDLINLADNRLYKGKNCIIS